MTLTTYRSPAARLLHATLEFTGRCRRSLRARSGPATRVQALTVLETAALRDMGIISADFESFGAQADVGTSPRFTPVAVVRA